jgi:hypothetical protein
MTHNTMRSFCPGTECALTVGCLQTALAKASDAPRPQLLAPYPSAAPVQSHAQQWHEAWL